MPNIYLPGGILGGVAGAVGGALSTPNVEKPSDLFPRAGLGALLGVGAGLLGTRLAKKKILSSVDKVDEAIRRAAGQKATIDRHSSGIAGDLEEAQKIRLDIQDRTTKNFDINPYLSYVDDLKKRIHDSEFAGATETAKKLTDELNAHMKDVNASRLFDAQIRERKNLLESASNEFQKARKDSRKYLLQQILSSAIPTALPGGIIGFSAGKVLPNKQEPEKVASTALELYKPLSKATQEASPGFLSRVLKAAPGQIGKTLLRPGALVGGVVGGIASSGEDVSPLRRALGIGIGAVGGGLAGRGISRLGAGISNSLLEDERIFEKLRKYRSSSSLVDKELDKIQNAKGAIDQSLRRPGKTIDSKTHSVVADVPINKEELRKQLKNLQLDEDFLKDRSSHYKKMDKIEQDYINGIHKIYQNAGLVSETIPAAGIGAVSGALSSYLGRKNDMNKTSAVKDMALSVGKGALMGLGVAGGGALVGAAINKGKSIVQDLHKATYYKEMLDANPGLQDEAVNAKEVQRHFNTLFKFNPNYASDPVVAGSYVRNALDYARPNIDTINNIVNARKNIVQTSSLGKGYDYGKAIVENVVANSPEYVEMASW